MKNAILKNSVKYSYQYFMELVIYADLDTALKHNDKIVTSTDLEYEDVLKFLNESKLKFECKSKREILILGAR